MKETTYTLKEFNAILDANQNTGRYIERKLMKNKVARDCAIFLGALTIDFNKVAYAAVDTKEAFTKIDMCGYALLGLAKKIGFWVCIIMASIEIIKCLFQGENKDIIKIITKYILAFSTLNILPWFFDWIVGFFG